MNIKCTVKGFTLVELMIGLLLGTIIMAAIGKIFVDSNRNFKKQQNIGRMMEDARYTTDILAKEFRRIGYLRRRFNVEIGSADKVFVADNDILSSDTNFANSEFIHGAFDGQGFDKNPHDINHIVFRYQLENTVSDVDNTTCTNGLDPDLNEITNVLSLYLYIGESSGSSSLLCKAKLDTIDTAGVITNVKTLNATPLVSNIERFYVLYKVGENYLRADQIVDWKVVTAARLYLIFYSADSGLSLATPNYLLTGRPITPINVNENRLYRNFSMTISFRNGGL